MHIFGIEEMTVDPGSPTTEEEVKQQLRRRIQELEETVRTLEYRIKELEQHNTSLSVVSAQVDALLRSNVAVCHGPNTIEHFKEFSLDTVSAEIKQNAPALYQLFQALCHNISMGDSREEDRSQDDIKAVTSLSVVLKSRSPKVLGLQLLIGMMLVGRATNRRVRETTLKYIIYSKVAQRQWSCKAFTPLYTITRSVCTCHSVPIVNFNNTIYTKYMQAITVLNHAGISVSYTTAWKYLHELILQSKFQEMIKTGR